MGISKHKRVVESAVLFVVAGIAVLPGLLWLDHKRETTLPTPTGPFAVGRMTQVWNNFAQADFSAPQPGTKRELIAWC